LGFKTYGKGFGERMNSMEAKTTVNSNPGPTLPSRAMALVGFVYGASVRYEGIASLMSTPLTTMFAMSVHGIIYSIGSAMVSAFIPDPFGFLGAGVLAIAATANFKQLEYYSR